MDSNITGQSGAGASTVAESVKQAAQSVKETFQTKTQQAKERLQQTKEQISSRARETTRRMRAEGEELLDEQKTRVADRIGNYGRAVHEAAEQLEQEHDAAIAFYTHRMADQLERGANYLRGQNWNGLRQDVEQFARGHQELYFGGLFIAGLGLARFLKAGRVERSERDVDEEKSRGEEVTASIEARYEAPYVSTTPGGASGTMSGASVSEKPSTAGPGAGSVESGGGAGV